MPGNFKQFLNPAQPYQLKLNFIACFLPWMTCFAPKCLFFSQCNYSCTIAHHLTKSFELAVSKGAIESTIELPLNIGLASPCREN